MITQPFQYKTISTIAILTILVYTLISCGKSDNSFRVGFLLHSLSDQRWSIEQDIFTQQIESLGGKVVSSFADNDERKQYHLAEEMINEGVKVLVVVPVNSNSAASIARLGKKNNVKIIAYDIIIDNCDLEMS